MVLAFLFCGNLYEARHTPWHACFGMISNSWITAYVRYVKAPVDFLLSVVMKVCEEDSMS